MFGVMVSRFPLSDLMSTGNVFLITLCVAMAVFVMCAGGVLLGGDIGWW